MQDFLSFQGSTFIILNYGLKSQICIVETALEICEESATGNSNINIYYTLVLEKRP